MLLEFVSQPTLLGKESVSALRSDFLNLCLLENALNAAGA